MAFSSLPTFCFTLEPRVLFPDVELYSSHAYAIRYNVHYTIMPMQYAAVFNGCIKNDNF